MPMVSSGFSVLSEDFAAAPYRYFAWLREHVPVHYEPHGRQLLPLPLPGREAGAHRPRGVLHRDAPGARRAGDARSGPRPDDRGRAHRQAKDRRPGLHGAGPAGPDSRHPRQRRRPHRPLPPSGADGPRQRFRQALRHQRDPRHPRPGQEGLATSGRLAQRGRRVHHQHRPPPERHAALSGLRRAVGGLPRPRHRTAAPPPGRGPDIEAVHCRVRRHRHERPRRHRADHQRSRGRGRAAWTRRSPCSSST